MNKNKMLIILIILILIIIILNYSKIFLFYAKNVRPEFYNFIFFPELYPLLLYKNTIKEELYNALNSPIHKIYRKQNEWTKSKNGENFINKVNNLKGWVHGWNNNNDIHENWLNFGLIYENKVLNANSKICPKTCKILKNINGINIAGFSLLKGNSKIEEHRDSTGIDDNSIALHLGLIVPKKKCILTVNNKKMYEENFKLFGVDSNYLHSAENNSNEIRVILYIDKSLI